MIIFRLEKLPSGYKGYTSDAAFGEREARELKALGISEAWYWYGYYGYEGVGQMLILKDGKYYLHDMGHCSCYGPIENISFTDPFSSLEEIKVRCSTELYGYVKALVEMAEADSHQGG